MNTKWRRTKEIHTEKRELDLKNITPTTSPGFSMNCKDKWTNKPPLPPPVPLRVVGGFSPPPILHLKFPIRPSSNTEVLNHVMTSQVPRSKRVGWNEKPSEIRKKVMLFTHSSQYNNNNRKNIRFRREKSTRVWGILVIEMRCFDHFACQFHNSIFSSDDQSLHHFYCWVSSANPAWTSSPPKKIFGMKLRVTLQKTEKKQRTPSKRIF